MHAVCFRTYRMVYNIWAWLVEGLGISAYVGGEAELANRCVEMYSSTTEAQLMMLLKTGFWKTFPVKTDI